MSACAKDIIIVYHSYFISLYMSILLSSLKCDSLLIICIGNLAQQQALQQALMNQAAAAAMRPFGNMNPAFVCFTSLLPIGYSLYSFDIVNTFSYSRWP
jgi:hypothetical protein